MVAPASSPGLPGGTYSIEALGADGGVLAEELTTVGAHPGERPVHGFATSFQDDDVPAILEWLRALRCTVVQIYDWMAEYAAPLGPPEGWKDPSGRPVSYTALRSLAAGHPSRGRGGARLRPRLRRRPTLRGRSPRAAHGPQRRPLRNASST